MKNTTTKTGGDSKTVELLKAHRHAGRDWPAGALITLRKEQAEWLVAKSTARDVTPAAQAD